MGNRKCIFFLALVACGCNTNWPDTHRLDKLESEMQDMRVQMASVKKDLSLERQDRCAKQAAYYFKTHWARPYYLFVTHYSRSLDRCFARIHRGVSWGEDVYLVDVFEGVTYGAFRRVYGRAGRPHNVYTCYVKAASGDDKKCTTEEGFNALEKQLIEQ
jgi:hypothetical protein